MALQYTNIGWPSYVPSSTGAVYTNPSSTKTYLKGVVLYNGNITAEVVQLYLVQNSTGSVGTAGVGNKIAKLSLTANETLVFDFPHPFVMTGTNDTLQADTTTASKVTVTPIGDKE